MAVAGTGLNGAAWQRKPVCEVKAWRWFPLRLSPRTALLVHGPIDFLNRLCESVAHSDKILPGLSLLALGQAKEGIVAQPPIVTSRSFKAQWLS
jgi:hypothetical protein